jgi:DNA-binding Xre family transcriptional regulator
MNWMEQLDKLKAQRQYTDTELSGQLGISKTFLADLRAGRRPFPPAVRFAILDMLGYDMTRDALLLLLPTELSDKIKASDVKRGKNRAAKKDSL